MIIHPEYNMIPALKILWKEGFKDDDKYIDFFFSNRFKPENTFVYMENGSPVSMASVFNAKLYLNSVFLPAGYIYAVTTLPVHQGKGFSTAILEHINKIYPTTFLVPLAGALNFYEKRGFTPAFTLNEIELHLCDIKAPDKNFITKTVSADEYKHIRDSHFINDGYICWDTEAIAYALAENTFCGGSAVKIEIDEKKGTHGILLYKKQNGRLLITETTLPLPMLHGIAYNLMKQENVSTCCLRLASGKLASSKTSASRPFGLLYKDTGGAAVKNGYCNLVLD